MKTNSGAIAKVIGVTLVLWFLLLPPMCSAKPPRRVENLAISPDGKFIALSYLSGDTTFIYTVALETGKAVRLTSAKTGEELSPAFSPDGKRIAYTYLAGKEAHSQIIIVSSDGSDPHSWSPSEVSDFGPLFSSDNKTIVFSRSGFFGNYSPIAQPHAHDWSFYAADLDGTNVRQITNESFYMVSAPSFSPDGKKMVVMAEGLETSQHLKVYSITDPGQALQTLQPHVPNEVSHKDPIFNCPNYLPDGTILVMAADRRFNYDVYRVNPDSGAIEKLTNENGYATDLKVSVDGKTAVFLKWKRERSEVTDESELYVLDMQSQKLTPIVISGLN
jgi:TolB protein